MLLADIVSPDESSAIFLPIVPSPVREDVWIVQISLGENTVAIGGKTGKALSHMSSPPKSSL